MEKKNKMKFFRFVTLFVKRNQREMNKKRGKKTRISFGQQNDCVVVLVVWLSQCVVSFKNGGRGAGGGEGNELSTSLDIRIPIH